MLNYGNGFFGSNQPGAELVRIDYLGAKGDRAPTVNVTASQDEGSSPLTVSFTSTVADPEGRRLKYAWDFDGDGDIDSRQTNPTFTYSEDGVYRATLTVTDQGGRVVSDYVDITVGQRPVVELTVTTDANGFQFGDTVQYSVAVDDDQPTDCTKVSVTYILGHDDPRAPADHRVRVHRVDHDDGAVGSRPGDAGPERRLRGVLHRPGQRQPAAAHGHGPGRHRAGRAVAARTGGGCRVAAPPAHGVSSFSHVAPPSADRVTVPSSRAA